VAIRESALDILEAILLSLESILVYLLCEAESICCGCNKEIALIEPRVN
jgi:hypothetical protein